MDDTAFICQKCLIESHLNHKLGSADEAKSSMNVIKTGRTCKEELESATTLLDLRVKASLILLDVKKEEI